MPPLGRKASGTSSSPAANLTSPQGGRAESLHGSTVAQEQEGPDQAQHDLPALWSTLPDTVVAHVFQLLAGEQPHLLRAPAETCQQWRRIAYEVLLYDTAASRPLFARSGPAASMHGGASSALDAPSAEPGGHTMDPDAHEAPVAGMGQHDALMEGGGQCGLYSPSQARRGGQAASSSRRSPRVGARRGAQSLPPRMHTRRGAAAAAAANGVGNDGQASAMEVDEPLDHAAAAAGEGSRRPSPPAAWCTSPVSCVQQPAFSHAGQNMVGDEDREGATAVQAATDAAAGPSAEHARQGRHTHAHSLWLQAAAAATAEDSIGPRKSVGAESCQHSTQMPEEGVARGDVTQRGRQDAPPDLHSEGGDVRARWQGRGGGAGPGARGHAHKRSRDDGGMGEGVAEAIRGLALPPTRRTRHTLAHTGPAVAGPSTLVQPRQLGSAVAGGEVAAVSAQDAAGPSQPVLEPQASVGPPVRRGARQADAGPSHQLPAALLLQYAARPGLHSNSGGIGSVGEVGHGVGSGEEPTLAMNSVGAEGGGAVTPPSITVMGHEGNALGPGGPGGLVVDQEASVGRPASSVRGQLHVAATIEPQLDAEEARTLTDGQQMELLMLRAGAAVEMADDASDVGPATGRRAHRRAGIGARGSRQHQQVQPQPAASVEQVQLHAPASVGLLEAVGSGGLAALDEAEGVPGVQHAPQAAGAHTHARGAHARRSTAGERGQAVGASAAPSPGLPQGLHEALSVGPATAAAASTLSAGGSGTSSEVGPMGPGGPRGPGRNAAAEPRAGTVARRSSRRRAGAAGAGEAAAVAGAAVSGAGPAAGHGGDGEDSSEHMEEVNGAGGTVSGGGQHVVEAADSAEAPPGNGHGGARRRAGGSATVSDASWGLWGNSLQAMQEWVRGPNSARHRAHA